MSAKTLDISWGSPGSALLPKSLREVWANEALPDWIGNELGLPAGSSAAALDSSVWKVSGVEELASRQRNFLLNLVQARRSEIQSVRVFSQPVPYWLDLKELPFSVRTRNCLVNANLLGENEQLTNMTYRRLFDIRSMGVKSILEFACLVESALERASGSGQPHAFTEDELLEIISEPWVDQVGAADPRFSDIIPPLPHANIFEILDNLTSGPGDESGALEQLAEAMPELQRRLKKIEALPLEQQLEGFLQALSRFDGERLQALVDRFGWSGSPAITLEEAGARLGITRERLRQLQEKVQTRLKAISYLPYLPALDRALRVLAEAGRPLNVEAAASLLKSSGVSAKNFHPSCVIAAAVACGRTPPISLQTVGKRTIVAATAISNVDEILRVANRQAHASGASNVSEVIAELQSLGVKADETSVRHALREFSEVEFLEQDWFCHRPTNPERDRLRNVTRKILSVTSPIELSVIREGVRREYQYRKYRGLKKWSLLVPPRSVLRAYYQAHPEFNIDENDLVKPIDPLDYRMELALTDTILVDVLRSSPTSVLDRASFAAECERRSMNMNTFSIYLTYSPVIVHLGTDIWALRGIRVDPVAVEAVRAANALRPREKRVLDHGWNAQGQLWVATRLPSTHVGNIAVGIPGAIKHYLAGRQFKALDEDGVMHGTIRINDEGASSGFSAFLRQRGADEGDILIAEFDLSGSAALLRLGDDELLEAMSPEV
jgi:Bacterial RNA polymerase, alpha chain C terminal domain/Sigma-70, region 4